MWYDHGLLLRQQTLLLLTRLTHLDLWLWLHGSSNRQKRALFCCPAPLVLLVVQRADSMRMRMRMRMKMKMRRKAAAVHLDRYDFERV